MAAARTSPPTWPAEAGRGVAPALGAALRAAAPVAVPAALAAAIASAYLIGAPASADLATQAYRADLFSRAGFVLFDTAWYGGHPVPAYSVLFPPLGALLGVRAVGALAVVGAAAAFAALTRGSRAAAGWFAAGVALQLLTGRITFLLGVAIGLAALLAAARGRRASGLALAALTPLASPVAGVFLALAGAAWALGGRRALGVALAAAALAPAIALALLFGEGGTEPFAPSAFWPALTALVALAALLHAGGRRTLAAGAALAALLCVAAFAVPNPIGGNATRLGALFAGPVAACALWPRRRVALAVLALPLAWWQLQPPVRDAAVAAADPSVQAGYYAPLLARLHAAGGPPGRLEIPFTRDHWEAARVAPAVPLARGWERQVDRRRNALFYDARPLTAARYRAWLHDNAVRWVALPGAPLDASARAEAALLRAGVAGLRPVWRSDHWRLWEVAGARGLASGAATLTALRTDGFSLRFARPGIALVRVRWSPYWAVVGGGGCVARGGGDWTVVRSPAAGPVAVEQRFSLVRGLTAAAGPRCRRAG